MRVKHLLAPLALQTAFLLSGSASRPAVAASQVTIYPDHPLLVIGRRFPTTPRGRATTFTCRSCCVESFTEGYSCHP
jgi:hypothetical protein